jgi:hypothetical protein
VLCWPLPEIQINLLDNADTIDEITLSSILGTHYNSSFESNGSKTYVDISSLSKGLYFVAVKTKSNLKYIKKLLVE